MPVVAWPDFKFSLRGRFDFLQFLGCAGAIKQRHYLGKGDLTMPRFVSRSAAMVGQSMVEFWIRIAFVLAVGGGCFAFYRAAARAERNGDRRRAIILGIACIAILIAGFAIGYYFDIFQETTMTTMTTRITRLTEPARIAENSAAFAALPRSRERFSLQSRKPSAAAPVRA